jgi:uncharacterized membrane protein
VSLSSFVDSLVPGPDTAFDRASLASHALVERIAATRLGGLKLEALHGNRWLGHPLHPAVVPLPLGAWCVSSWFDARSARTGAAEDEHAADVALRVGIAGSLVAASTGLAQYLDTRDAVRRETTLHAALNSAALTLYVASWAARKRGRRRLGRRLSSVALVIVGASGYLGGEISYRHGVGMRPQLLRNPGAAPQDTVDLPFESAGALHQ